MVPELTHEELADGFDCVIEEVLGESRVQGPPVDAFVVARAMGIMVALDDRQGGRARYVRLSDRRSGCSRATILLRPEPRFERRQWAVAHEIGEHVACRVFDHWGVEPMETAGNAREQVANHLAGRLLMPSGWFNADAVRCEWDLIALKRRYNTASHELIARRMLECRPPVVISIFDHDRVSFRRGNMPGRVPSPLPVELECWSHVRRHCRPWRTRRSPCLVCGWPVHEKGWKREILRMEVAGWS